MHYYKREIKAYLAATARLSFRQHGIYCLLIDACYDRERCPATLDEACDWLWISCEEERQDLSFLLDRFFDKDEEGYTHNRIMTDVEAYHAKAEVNKANGAKGGRPKKTQAVKKETQKDAGRELSAVGLNLNQMVY